jgi:hypothetical protein
LPRHSCRTDSEASTSWGSRVTDRDYRLVSQDGVASASDLQRDQDAWHRKRQQGAPETTVDALMFSLRSRGLEALSEPITQQRLSELSKAQAAEIIVRLHRLRGKYPKVCDRLIVRVGEIYEAS